MLPRELCDLTMEHAVCDDGAIRGDLVLDSMLTLRATRERHTTPELAVLDVVNFCCLGRTPPPVSLRAFGEVACEVARKNAYIIHNSSRLVKPPILL